jgi:ABC-2 type transport system permease protein
MAFTITRLTIRQFLRSRSIFVVLGLALLPSGLALIVQLAANDLSLNDRWEIFADILYQGMYVGTLLPLATLILATSAIGDEIEDRTLQYLALKPISRARIVLEKALAAFVVLAPAIWLGIATMWTIVAWGDFDGMRELLVPALLSSLVAVVGFGSLFLLLSMVIQRALLVGIFYVFIWESSLSRWLPGLRAISIRHYTESLFVRLVDDRTVTVDQASAQGTLLITVGCLTVLSLVLATWRLRAMSLE